jgi:signal transduction histidine kinase
MANRKAKPEGQLFFGVDARHIRQLGQELVGDRTTALTELIKNAYDADATEVTLDFENAEEAGGTLEILDDGVGMPLEDVRAGWMQISTPAKDDEPVSRLFKRQRAGRKGIGRFATETLGRVLVLRTTVKGDPTALSIRFDWEHDYPSGHDLTEIANPYWTEEAPKSEHGTLLRIEGLYDPWSEAPKQRVRRSILLLQPPFPVARSRAGKSKADPGFRVEMFVDGDPDDQDIDYNDFLKSGTARVVASVSSRGKLKVTVKSEHLGLDESETLDQTFRKVGPLKLEASYFVFKKDALAGTTVRVAQAMAREFAGIRLYRDEMRVMPYGEPENDWLGLEKLQGSRSGTLVPVANRNWFGQVSIARDTNPDLRDTASREGLVENEAFAELKTAVGEALVWAAGRVGSARQRKVKTSSSPTLTRRDVLADTQKTLETALKNELPAKVRDRVLPVVSSAFSNASSVAEADDAGEAERVESLLNELELLRVLASLGTSIAVFSHEVRSALTACAAAIGVLSEGGTAEKQLERANDALEELQDLAGYIDAYASASRRRDREPQAVHTVISEFVNRFSQNLARHIDFSVSVEPPSLRTTPIARSELDAILFNLLTNSVKAMDAEGHPQRRISVSAKADKGDVAIRFQDTGTGIDSKIRDRIFEPFVSDTRSPVSELGVGTGLGLKVVKDIAEENGGDALVVKPVRPFKTSIEIRLPRWEKQKAGK